MFPFASYVSRGQSKPRLIFSRINGPNGVLRLSAKISVLLRLSVKFFQLRLTKKLKINFFCFKELNVNKPVFFLTLKQNKGLHLGMK